MNDVTFESLKLSEPILKALKAEGYETPTPIQVQAIPPLLAGRDLLGCAQTGTGKTAAFAVPIIQRFSEQRKTRERRSARALIVTPTRELAAQIDESFANYGRFSAISHALVFGGVGKGGQVKALSNGIDVLVATPGRLLDLIHDGAIRLDLAEVVVLDEADRMLDMGFIHDVKKIIALLPKVRQTMLFSATMPDTITEIANSILHDPIKVAVTPVSSTVEKISQSVMYVGKKRKKDLLVEVLRRPEVTKTLVFTRTKHLANRLSQMLCEEGIVADAIHANKSQNNRLKALERFKEGGSKVLVATDIAARGIDVDGISHVINYDIPNEPETYVHRIGRTARAGAEGCAFSFCDSEEKPLIRAIERLIKQTIPTGSHQFEASFSETDTANAEVDFVNRPQRGRGGNHQGGNRPGSDRSSSRGQRPSSGGQRFSGSGQRPASAGQSPSQGNRPSSQRGPARPAASSGQRSGSSGQQSSRNDRPISDRGQSSSRPAANRGSSGSPTRDDRSRPADKRTNVSSSHRSDSPHRTDVDLESLKRTADIVAEIAGVQRKR